MRVHKYAAITVMVGLAIGFTPGTATAKAHKCGVVDHRAAAGATIDDNTLEGVTSNAKRGFRSEIDGRVLLDGYTIYHENTWEQYTTGTGTPETSTAAYVDGLTTLDNNQQVPLMNEVITQVRRHDGKILMELDEPDAWTVPAIAGLVDTLKARNVWDQWIFTGTKGALSRLKEAAPNANVRYRKDNDETFTYDMAEKYGVDGLMVDAAFGERATNRWRNHGYKVWGRQSDKGEYRRLYRMGIRTLQTGAPGKWMNYCGRRAN